MTQYEFEICPVLDRNQLTIAGRNGWQAVGVIPDHRGSLVLLQRELVEEDLPLDPVTVAASAAISVSESKVAPQRELPVRGGRAKKQKKG